jgi:hypothetical protein
MRDSCCQLHAPVSSSPVLALAGTLERVHHLSVVRVVELLSAQTVGKLADLDIAEVALGVDGELADGVAAYRTVAGGARCVGHKRAVLGWEDAECDPVAGRWEVEQGVAEPLGLLSAPLDKKADLDDEIHRAGVSFPKM